jgi:hypothetical protein
MADTLSDLACTASGSCVTGRRSFQGWSPTFHLCHHHRFSRSFRRPTINSLPRSLHSTLSDQPFPTHSHVHHSTRSSPEPLRHANWSPSSARTSSALKTGPAPILWLFLLHSHQHSRRELVTPLEPQKSKSTPCRQTRSSLTVKRDKDVSRPPALTTGRHHKLVTYNLNLSTRDFHTVSPITTRKHGISLLINTQRR